MFATKLKNKEGSYTNNVIQLEEIVNVPPRGIEPQPNFGFSLIRMRDSRSTQNKPTLVFKPKTTSHFSL
jgi:hypothetical protein